MFSPDVIFRRSDPFGATMYRLIFLSLAALVLSISTACVPKVPKVESSSAPLLSRNELEGRGPMGIAVAPEAVQETDSRGWFWWQFKPDTTLDIIRAPIFYGWLTVMFPLTFPVCYMDMTTHETYIRQVSEEMDVQMVLRDAIVKELRQSFSPEFAFSMGGEGAPFGGEAATGKARTILELTGVKVYLDSHSQSDYKRDLTLIVESRWLMRDGDGSRENERVHEVSVRSSDNKHIPFELFLLIDEHAKAVVKRLTGA